MLDCPCRFSPEPWNLWEIERLVREQHSRTIPPARRSGTTCSCTCVTTHHADGALPVDFDALVRESFGELVAGRNT